jgi:3-hydroxybutyryl-CoA dehydrogenase
MNTSKSFLDTIKTVAVIGAGQMGSGIAQVIASCGYSTLLWDANSSALAKGQSAILERLEKLLAKGKLSEGDLSTIKTNLPIVTAFETLKEADLVIEAVIENFEAKRSVFQAIDAIAKPTAILASNTSSISITRLASTVKRPDQFTGIHFMNPVPLMKLVELIPGLQTSKLTLEISQAFCARLDKKTVVAVDGPGFIVNRVLCPMINEAIFLLQEGCTAEDIDIAMKLGTNQPMGPLELADFVGLDTLLFILKILHDELGEDKYRPCPLLVKYVQAGWYGKKTGRGFYSY